MAAAVVIVLVIKIGTDIVTRIIAVTANAITGKPSQLVRGIADQCAAANVHWGRINARALPARHAYPLEAVALHGVIIMLAIRVVTSVAMEIAIQVAGKPDTLVRAIADHRAVINVWLDQGNARAVSLIKFVAITTAMVAANGET